MHCSKDYVSYIANAGVLVNMGGKKILIDALCQSETPLYKSTPENVYQSILKQEPPFDGIDFLLVTHHHSDHFNRDMVVSFLESSKKTAFISTEGIVSRIQRHAPQLDSNRFYAMAPGLRHSQSLKKDGVTIRAMSMIHDGEEFSETQNLAFLIDNGKKVMHLGDAAPVPENFQSFGMKGQEINLLLANFPYAGIPGARKTVRECIAPKKMAVIHLPDPNKDRWGWIKATQRSHERVSKDFTKTIFLKEAGDRAHF